MPIEYVVDAHTLIWYVEDSPRLGADAGRIMDDPASALFVPAIALAEASWVVEKGRTSVPTVNDFLADVDADPRITIVPFDRAILDVSFARTAPGEMHDRLIVATALNRAALGASLYSPATQTLRLLGWSP